MYLLAMPEIGCVGTADSDQRSALAAEGCRVEDGLFQVTRHRLQCRVQGTPFLAAGESHQGRLSRLVDHNACVMAHPAPSAAWWKCVKGAERSAGDLVPLRRALTTHHIN